MCVCVCVCVCVEVSESSESQARFKKSLKSLKRVAKAEQKPKKPKKKTKKKKQLRGGPFHHSLYISRSPVISDTKVTTALPDRPNARRADVTDLRGAERAARSTVLNNDIL